MPCDFAILDIHHFFIQSWPSMLRRSKRMHFSHPPEHTANRLWELQETWRKLSSPDDSIKTSYRLARPSLTRISSRLHPRRVVETMRPHHHPITSSSEWRKQSCYRFVLFWNLFIIEVVDVSGSFSGNYLFEAVEGMSLGLLTWLWWYQYIVSFIASLF